jgi:protein dithiol oxidoreductase (disulfide-forming)
MNPGLLARLLLVPTLCAGMLALAWTDGAHAQQVRARINYEYRTIDPQPVATGEQIELIEFFWYGCPYCYQLQPPLEAWLARKPADVQIRRVPAIFRESWIPHARLYYTLEALKEVDRLHQAVYRSYHVDRESLNTVQGTLEWAARNGIDPARWRAAYNSPEIDKQVERSLAYTRSHEVQGTPSLVVDGRYITSSGMSESMPGVITILDDLIVIARARRAAGK